MKPWSMVSIYFAIKNLSDTRGSNLKDIVNYVGQNCVSAAERKCLRTKLNKYLKFGVACRIFECDHGRYKIVYHDAREVNNTDLKSRKHRTQHVARNVCGGNRTKRGHSETDEFKFQPRKGIIRKPVKCSYDKRTCLRNLNLRESDTSIESKNVNKHIGNKNAKKRRSNPGKKEKNSSRALARLTRSAFSIKRVERPIFCPCEYHTMLNSEKNMPRQLLRRPSSRAQGHARDTCQPSVATPPVKAGDRYPLGNTWFHSEKNPLLPQSSKRPSSRRQGHARVTRQRSVATPPLKSGDRYPLGNTWFHSEKDPLLPQSSKRPSSRRQGHARVTRQRRVAKRSLKSRGRLTQGRTRTRPLKRKHNYKKDIRFNTETFKAGCSKDADDQIITDQFKVQDSGCISENDLPCFNEPIIFHPCPLKPNRGDLDNDSVSEKKKKSDDGEDSDDDSVPEKKKKSDNGEDSDNDSVPEKKKKSDNTGERDSDSVPEKKKKSGNRGDSDNDSVPEKKKKSDKLRNVEHSEKVESTTSNQSMHNESHTNSTSHVDKPSCSRSTETNSTDRNCEKPNSSGVISQSNNIIRTGHGSESENEVLSLSNPITFGDGQTSRERGMSDDAVDRHDNQVREIFDPEEEHDNVILGSSNIGYRTSSNNRRSSKKPQ